MTLVDNSVCYLIASLADYLTDALSLIWLIMLWVVVCMILLTTLWIIGRGSLVGRWRFSCDSCLVEYRVGHRVYCLVAYRVDSLL